MSGSEADRRIPHKPVHTRARMSIDEKTSKTLQDLGAKTPEAIAELFAEVTSALEDERQALIAEGAADERERGERRRAENQRDVAEEIAERRREQRHLERLLGLSLLA